MKATGIVRKLDNLGRIVVPKELRNVLGIEPGDPVEIFTDGGDIILRKYAPGCVFCGESKDTLQLNDKLICRKCAAKIRSGL